MAKKPDDRYQTPARGDGGAGRVGGDADPAAGGAGDAAAVTGSDRCNRRRRCAASGGGSPALVCRCLTTRESGRKPAAGDRPGEWRRAGSSTVGANTPNPDVLGGNGVWESIDADTQPVAEMETPPSRAGKPEVRQDAAAFRDRNSQTWEKPIFLHRRVARPGPRRRRGCLLRLHVQGGTTADRSSEGCPPSCS